MGPCASMDFSVRFRKGRKMAHIYTKSGDCGMTSLFSGERASKAGLRVEAYGTVDELQSCLGLARALCAKQEVREVLYETEKALFHAMTELATVDADSRITSEHVARLESLIDAYSPERFSFRVPGANASSSVLHIARTVARRCERCVIRLDGEVSLAPNLKAFFNRLSDLLYVLACFEAGEEEER